MSRRRPPPSNIPQLARLREETPRELAIRIAGAWISHQMGISLDTFRRYYAPGAPGHPDILGDRWYVATQQVRQVLDAWPPPKGLDSERLRRDVPKDLARRVGAAWLSHEKGIKSMDYYARRYLAEPDDRWYLAGAAILDLMGRPWP
jgi:hypothetical protein